MSKHTIALLTSLMLAACGGGEAGQQEEAAPAEPAADEAALTELSGYWQTHYNMHHPDMVAGTYADSAVVLSADGTVAMGKEAIAGWLTGQMAASPTAEISEMHQRLFGDMGISMGTYSVQATPEGMEPMEYGGSYLSVASRATGEWKLVGMITNYDSARPEGWSWGPVGETPPENGTMGELIAEFTRHWNLNHASMVADFYAEDAVVSFSDAEMAHGRAAVAALLEERFAQPTTVTIHDVDTWPLEDGYVLDGGWYELAVGDQRVQAGAYMNLVERQEDGSWQILWSVTNAQPPRDM